MSGKFNKVRAGLTCANSLAKCTRLLVERIGVRGLQSSQVQSSWSKYIKLAAIFTVGAAGGGIVVLYHRVGLVIFQPIAAKIGFSVTLFLACYLFP